MKTQYQVCGYLYEDAENPTRETGLVYIGDFIANSNRDLPISEDAHVQVEYLWTLERVWDLRCSSK
jgi:hypothetical protein